jgi:hypothetical protein
VPVDCNIHCLLLATCSASLIVHPLYFAPRLVVCDLFVTVCMIRFLLVATLGASWLHLARRVANVHFGCNL